jgi:hypothetical protein
VREQDKIKTLGLARSGLWPSEAQEVAEYVRVSSVLTDLNLEDNEIGVEGGKAIAKALHVNSALTSLDVRWNNLGERGKRVLRDATNAKVGFELLV